MNSLGSRRFHRSKKKNLEKTQAKNMCPVKTVKSFVALMRVIDKYENVSSQLSCIKTSEESVMDFRLLAPLM